jgi:hypothetical protein
VESIAKPAETLAPLGRLCVSCTPGPPQPGEERSHARRTKLIETTPTRESAVAASAVTPTPVGDASRTTVTSHDPYAGRRAGSGRLVQAVYLVFGLIEALLLIRFVLRALGANAEAGFAWLIYGVTTPLVAPFVGLFGTPQITIGAVLELHTFIALLVYAALGVLLARATWLIVGEGRSASVASVKREQTRVR